MPPKNRSTQKKNTTPEVQKHTRQRSKSMESTPENKRKKISSDNSQQLLELYLFYEQKFDDYFQDLDVRKIMKDESKKIFF